MMPENNWYGHTFVLARYCGLRALSPPIYGALSHGWGSDYSKIGRPSFTAAPLLAWNEQQAAAAVAAGVPKVTTIGSPFVYACRSIVGEEEPWVPRGRGTLCMPIHSSPADHSDQDHVRLIDEVEATEEGPFTVALFFVDLERDECTSPYEKAGWRIVSFGRRDENLFLYRLIAEMVRHRAIVSDHLSTATWYAAHLRRRVRIIGPRPDHPRLVGFDHDALRNRWPAVHGDGIEGEDAIAMAGEELGASFVLSPAELRRALGWSSWRQPVASALRIAVDVRHSRGMRRGDRD